MGNIVCKKCGVTGNSKCPYCRTVFSDNRQEDMLSWILKRSIKKVKSNIPDDEPISWLEICMFMGNGTKKDDLVYGMEQLRKTLNLMEAPDNDYPSIKQYTCDHEWIFCPGEKSTIGCRHGS